MAKDNDVQLHPVAGGEDALLDVVFFHGLGGHHRDTWTQKNPRLFWPEALHKVMPSLRVWSLEYPSAIFRWTKGGAKAIGNTGTIATRVRKSLSAHRLMQAGGRPCVWVCHSLGGLVAKHVLLQNNSAGPADGHLDDALLQGIMFLGTPHRGSNKASFGQGFVSAIKSAAGMGETAIKAYLEALSGGVPVSALPNVSGQFGCMTGLIKDLEDRNDGLWSLDKDFRQYFGERWAGKSPLYASVVCEGQPMPFPPVMIVDEKSADPELKVTSNGEAVKPLVLPLDHVQLAKPESDTSELFMLLRELLGRVPALQDPYANKLHGLAGGRHAWHLAHRIGLSLERGSQTAVLNAWRNCSAIELKSGSDPKGLIVQIVQQVVGDASPEACLAGIETVGLVLKANQGMRGADSALLDHCDEIVGWLAAVCGAPLPFEPARSQDADALFYPGYLDPESSIDSVMVLSSHAQHKRWPLTSLGLDQPTRLVDTAAVDALRKSASEAIKLEDVAALDPRPSVRQVLERWELGTAIDDSQPLRECAEQRSLALQKPLTPRESIGLKQRVLGRHLGRNGIVVDARVQAMDADQESDLRQSPLLPILSVVRRSAEEEGEFQIRLEQAINDYRSRRKSFQAKSRPV